MSSLFEYDPNKWNAVFNDMIGDNNDVFFQKEYFDLFSLLDQGEPTLLAFNKDDKCVLYPFLKRKIGELDYLEDKKYNDYYDITTPYGYGGPISNCNDREFIGEYGRAFAEYCSNSNIVTEFIRFNPLSQNHVVFSGIYELIFNRKTIKMVLPGGADQILGNMTSKNRNTIKAAQRKGVEIEFDFDLKDIDSLRRLYYLTMDKANASPYYYFPHDFFDKMSINLGQKIFIAKAIYNNEIVSICAIFQFNNRMHYFLSANTRSGYDLDANSLLLYKVALWGAENGCQDFYLGGGVKENNDSLFRFKKRFNINGELDYYIAKKVHNFEMYNELKDKWSSSYRANVGSIDYFPYYRRQVGLNKGVQNEYPVVRA